MSNLFGQQPSGGQISLANGPPKTSQSAFSFNSQTSQQPAQTAAPTQTVPTTPQQPQFKPAVPPAQVAQPQITKVVTAPQITAPQQLTQQTAPKLVQQQQQPQQQPKVQFQANKMYKDEMSLNNRIQEFTKELEDFN